MKCVVVPVITGAAGMVTEGVKKHLEAVPGKHSIDPLQNSCTWNSTHSAESAAV
jgi:hypothetical protein